MAEKLLPPSLSEGQKEKSYFSCCEDRYRPQAKRWAIVISLLFHLALFLIIFPQVPEKIFHAPGSLINLRSLAPPPPAGLEKTVAPPLINPPPTAQLTPKPKAVIPVPDPTPDEPEPLVPEIGKTLNPTIVEEIDFSLGLGEVGAPPAGGGDQESVYTGGEPGLAPPILLNSPPPPYTEEARQKRVTGLVELRAIINQLGRVEQIRVTKTLDPGLDESAIKTIVNYWRFRPATLNGQSVLYEAVLIVEFNIY